MIILSTITTIIRRTLIGFDLRTSDASSRSIIVFVGQSQISRRQSQSEVRERLTGPLRPFWILASLGRNSNISFDGRTTGNLPRIFLPAVNWWLHFTMPIPTNPNPNSNADVGGGPLHVLCEGGHEKQAGVFLNMAASARGNEGAVSIVYIHILSVSANGIQ